MSFESSPLLPAGVSVGRERTDEPDLQPPCPPAGTGQTQPSGHPCGQGWGRGPVC